MTQICIDINDLYIEKQEQIIEAIEKETGKPISVASLIYEFFITVQIDEDKLKIISL